MAITKTINAGDGVSRLAVISYIDTGTVAAFDLDVGFTPRYVKVVNETSGDMMEWFQGMADAEAVKTLAAGTRSLITSNGITPVDDGTTHGFTVGLDTDVNVTSEQLSILAMG